MSEDAEPGPDPNEIRRHAKKMFTEMQYRQKYRRLDFYRPNLKQMEFHNHGEREVMLRASNQTGKTHGACAQMAMDVCGIYFDWYCGHRFLVPPQIERPFEFMGWAASTSQQKTRDGVQLKLLGPFWEENMLGTGMVPLDNIGKISMARGIQNFVDTVTIGRETGNKAALRFKTREQGRESFQGEPVDEILIDEDISRDDAAIYGECIARMITTRGRILISMTPLLGFSPIRKRFKNHEGTSMAEVVMSIYDCAVSKGGHIPDEHIPSIIADTPEAERDTRMFGADMQGEGAVFNVPVSRIQHHRDPVDFPPHWPWIWGVDFSHGGMSAASHPFAAVLAAHDRDNDIVYITEAIRLHKALPVNHVDRMKKNPLWEAPVAWPHDGGTHTAQGITIAKTYANLGLNMMATHATFPASLGGGFGFEDGIAEMERRFSSGSLLVSRHLTEYFDEYIGYHREQGLVKKVNDDLLSATRQLIMALGKAKSIKDARERLMTRQGRAQTRVAEDVEFELFP